MPENQFLAVLSLLGGILLFVLVLVLAWLCTRWLGMRYSGFRIGGAVQVLDRTAIGPDRTLVIVRAGGKVWMLGVTPQNITFLGDLDPEKFADLPQDTKKDMASASAATMADFSRALQDAMGKWGSAKRQKKDKQDE